MTPCAVQDSTRQSLIQQQGQCFNPQLASPVGHHEDSKTTKDKLPGSRASTVEPGSWWAASFRFCKSMGGSFAKFLKSFHRKPSTSLTGGSACFWPIPLPYPRCFVQGSNTDLNETSLFKFRQGVNILIAALDWLHLRRSELCPEEICLFQPLSKVQWRIVKFIESAMQAWRLCEPITSDSMGRSAGKIEDIEMALHRLASLQLDTAEIFEEQFPESSSNPFLPGSRGTFAPGLQRDSAGDFCARLPGFENVVAKKIVASRLDFKGEPNFDPVPFLDEKSKAVFQHPIQQALAPGESRGDPPSVRVYGSDAEVMQLLKKLDSTGRLGILREHEVLEGYQAGLFCVPKSSTQDRLIFDSRPFNTLEIPMQRWIASMGAAANLCDLHIPEGKSLITSGTDLREFYYGFQVGHERLRRNSLLIRMDPRELRGFRCYDPSLEAEGRPVTLGLRTLAMGDSMAVELAQTAHLGILVQFGLVDESSLLAMCLPPPRCDLFSGVVIDDLILFELVAKESLQDKLHDLDSPQLLRDALGRYRELGLIPHEGKTFYGETSSEFWGALLDGEAGFVRSSLKRTVPVLYATLGILKLGVCTISLLETLIGCWTSIFLFKRRLLSLLNVCYEALSSGRDQCEVLRLSQSLKDELLLCVLLCPLATTCLRARDSKFIYESDASDWGLAVGRAELPPWLRSEVHRHRLRKSVWTKLLSPVKSLQRIRGVLPPAEELPGEGMISSHPLHIELGTFLQFEELEKRKSPHPVHINVLELRGMVRSEKHAAMEFFPGRSFSLADSQVSLGAWLKGRSSSIALNQELQQSLPIHLGCGMVSNCGYIPSEVNAIDDPTRHVAIRAAEKKPELWFYRENFASDEEHLAAFDEWLLSYKADPYTISGLPPMDELRVSVDQSLFEKSRSKLFFEKNKKDARIRVASKKAASDEQNSHDLPSTVFDNELIFNPSASSLGRAALSPEACEILRTIPSSRFLVPRNWRVDHNWRPDFAGYLDLYSGAKGIARMVVSLGSCWALTFETSDDAAQDVLASSNKILIESLLQHSCVFGFGAAIFCGSFSRAVRPPVRDRRHPYGLESLSANMSIKVESGNVHSKWLSYLIGLCLSLNIIFWVENPDGSFLWLLDEWRILAAGDLSKSFRVDYCFFGCSWRKRTRIFSNSHLGGQHKFCSRDHSHRRLVGWSRCHKAPWTRVAQVYPRKLCWIVASAVLIDAGLLPNRRKINVACMAKVTNARIGEAANPGPRPKKHNKPREVHLLDNAELVDAHTSLLGLRVWDAFKRWCVSRISEEAFESLILCPATLCILVESFGRDLFKRGDSIYVLRQLVTLIQRWKPEFRQFLGKAWQFVSKWEDLEPSSHRNPLPPVVYQAMVSLAVLWNWPRVAALIVLTYESICRPGEVLGATRADLLLPQDLIVEDPDTMFLCINHPKGKRRGIGRVQHAKISDRVATKFISRAFGKLPLWALLYPASAASFRRRWDRLLSALAVPTSFGLTPASMRGGGAVRAYRANLDVTSICWRMRLKNLETLQHYLQEAGAISLYASLPEKSKARILSASQMYSKLLDGV